MQLCNTVTLHTQSFLFVCILQQWDSALKNPAVAMIACGLSFRAAGAPAQRSTFDDLSRKLCTAKAANEAKVVDKAHAPAFTRQLRARDENKGIAEYSEFWRFLWQGMKLYFGLLRYPGKTMADTFKPHEKHLTLRDQQLLRFRLHKAFPSFHFLNAERRILLQKNQHECCHCTAHSCGASNTFAAGGSNAIIHSAACFLCWALLGLSGACLFLRVMRCATILAC